MHGAERERMQTHRQRVAASWQPTAGSTDPAGLSAHHQR
jgi:hypothetical protein